VRVAARLEAVRAVLELQMDGLHPAFGDHGLVRRRRLLPGTSRTATFTVSRPARSSGRSSGIGTREILVVPCPFSLGRRGFV